MNRKGWDDFRRFRLNRNVRIREWRARSEREGKEGQQKEGGQCV